MKNFRKLTEKVLSIVVTLAIVILIFMFLVVMSAAVAQMSIDALSS